MLYLLAFSGQPPGHSFTIVCGRVVPACFYYDCPKSTAKVQIERWQNFVSAERPVRTSVFKVELGVNIDLCACVFTLLLTTRIKDVDGSWPA